MKRRFTPEPFNLHLSRLSFFEEIELGTILEDHQKQRPWLVVGKSDYTPHVRYQDILAVHYEGWNTNPILAYWATCASHCDCVEAASGITPDLPQAVRDQADTVRIFSAPHLSTICHRIGKVKNFIPDDINRALKGQLTLTENARMYNSPYPHMITAHVVCERQGDIDVNVGLSYVEQGARCPTLVMRPASTVINHFQHCRR